MEIKTNAKCAGCSSAIIEAVKKQFPDAELNLDLQSADKVLHVHGVPEDSETAARIVSAVQEAGFQGSWLTRGEENR